MILGHKDWVMLGAGIIPQEQLYEDWKNINRECSRCGRNLKPAQ